MSRSLYNSMPGFSVWVIAAAMSTADGLLLAIASALSHDLYYKILDPKADACHRLIVARALLLVLGAAASLIAIVVVSLLTPPPDEETQSMIVEVRVPKGKSILGSVH